MQKADLIVFKNPEDLANQFAGRLIEWIETNSEKTYHLAISGGKTPDLLFSVLAEKQANSELWQKVHFWWVDERMVAPDHPESNFGIAQHLLFSQINIPEQNIHRIKGENDPESEALSYSKQIRESLPHESNWPVFDLILLGMGEDGHTASIFPDQMKLLNSTQICEVAVHPQSGQKRVTLTGKVINNARKVCFLITGANKAYHLSEIFSVTDQATILPTAHIHPESGDLLWVIDEPASKLIEDLDQG